MRRVAAATRAKTIPRMSTPTSSSVLAGTWCDPMRGIFVLSVTRKYEKNRATKRKMLTIQERMQEWNQTHQKISLLFSVTRLPSDSSVLERGKTCSSFSPTQVLGNFH